MKRINDRTIRNSVHRIAKSFRKLNKRLGKDKYYEIRVIYIRKVLGF